MWVLECMHISPPDQVVILHPEVSMIIRKGIHVGIVAKQVLTTRTRVYGRDQTSECVSNSASSTRSTSTLLLLRLYYCGP
jgi:hypothetical protein